MWVYVAGMPNLKQNFIHMHFLWILSRSDKPQPAGLLWEVLHSEWHKLQLHNECKMTQQVLLSLLLRDDLHPNRSSITLHSVQKVNDHTTYFRY
jgi:hypothetical protein